MGPPSPVPMVNFKPGWPATYTDGDLDVLTDEAAGMFIHAAASSDLNAVLKSGQILDLVRGEVHRRSLRKAQASARRAQWIAVGALVLAAIVGVAQIVVAISTA